MITITKGEKAVFQIKLRDQEGDPYDLTGFDKFQVAVVKGATAAALVTEVTNAAGSSVAVDGNAILGRLLVTMGSDDTAGLTENETLDIDLELDNAGVSNKKRQRFKNILTVNPSVIS